MVRKLQTDSLEQNMTLTACSGTEKYHHR